jgi:hypothetical protein
VSAGDDVPLLLDLGGLAAQLAEVVQLGAADVTAGDDLDLLVCTGKVRSTPTPKLTLRTVKVSRTPPP